MTDVNIDRETGEILDPPAAAPAPKPTRKKAKKKANGRAPIPENETPRQRYLRRSVTHMTNALTAIDLIAGFGRNRDNYEYGEDDAASMIGRLEDALAEMQRDLARPVSREEERKARRTWRPA